VHRDPGRPLGQLRAPLDGGFEQGAASTRWTVVEGTGTGDLAGLEGDGGYVAKQGDPEVAYELRWSIG
jgi:Protein of unknown function (DUF3224)